MKIGGSGADTVINVATVKVRFGAVVLIEKLVFNVAYKKIGVAGSHFGAHNHAVKSIILKNFKLLQNDPDTGRIFSQPPLISFKRDKNIGNFLVRSAFQTSEQPGTFKCARARCKTCPFICNVEKLSGPKRSIRSLIILSVPHSANVIYCITCTLCKKLYIGETSRRLGDRFREHLREVEKDDKNASKPVAIDT